MVISGEDLKSLNFIQNANPQRFRETGYDVSVGKIFVPWDDDNNTGGTFVEEYEVPPQGVVLIFSEETVELPKDIVGFALPKTSLCEEGLLVLNTGIVDPSYRGMLSGTTINFRKSPVRLKRGDPFLRLVFQTMHPFVDVPFRSRDPKRGPVTAVNRSQALSHYRGRIEPPERLPGVTMVGCFGEMIPTEWRDTPSRGGKALSFPPRLGLIGACMGRSIASPSGEGFSGPWCSEKALRMGSPCLATPAVRGAPGTTCR